MQLQAAAAEAMKVVGARVCVRMRMAGARAGGQCSAVPLSGPE